MSSELQFNVSQLLQEYVGATRQYTYENEQLDLGDGTSLRITEGDVKMTRTKNGVLVDAAMSGNVTVECVRCLSDFSQPVEFDFAEEYFATVHATTGAPLPEPEEPDVFKINGNHLLDLGDAAREYTLINLPIAPICRPDCRGLSLDGQNRNDNPAADDLDDQVIDERLAALKQLLKGA
ncbi:MULTISPECIES: YceD family protein [Herpetosiphon]|uniref:YceD family protein n=1 Tax=Herpetosiphon TaxID=64 RepID=UPI000D7C254F|nr:DUF177 domain-containing protein [Herpetosiphon llansteffanensis]